MCIFYSPFVVTLKCNTSPRYTRCSPRLDLYLYPLSSFSHGRTLPFYSLSTNSFYCSYIVVLFSSVPSTVFCFGSIEPVLFRATPQIHTQVQSAISYLPQFSITTTYDRTLSVAQHPLFSKIRPFWHCCNQKCTHLFFRITRFFDFSVYFYFFSSFFTPFCLLAHPCANKDYP